MFFLLNAKPFLRQMYRAAHRQKVQFLTSQSTECFSKAIFKNVDSSDPRTLHQSILGELRPKEASSVSGCCGYMAFALHSIGLSFKIIR